MRKFIFFWAIFSVRSVFSQDLDAIRKGDIFSANGGISLSQIIYNSNRPTPSRKPYNYLLQGNVNLKFLGFLDAPFVFMYSNAGNSFTQPTFNQTSLHPKYKWVQLHLGTVSASWSPYTVNGHILSGAIADFSPGKWQFSLLYGRLAKATQPTGLVDNADAKYTYQRNGAGIKLGYIGNKKSLVANAFYSQDQASSISPDSFMSPAPMRNICGSIQGSVSPFKKWQLRGDLGLSLLNQDIRGWGGRDFALNPSTTLYKAAKIQSDWALGKNTLSVTWERIDPNYRTLGAYYFNNNLENITLGGQAQLLRGKWRIQGSIGKQRDNLDGTALSQMRRTVGNAAINGQLSKRFTANASYSNFLSFTNLRSFTDLQNNSNPYARWDTLNYRQISQNVNAGLQVQIRNDSLKVSQIMINSTVQNGVDRRNGRIENGNLFVNGMASWATQWKKSKAGFVLSAMMSRSSIAGHEVWAMAPVLNWSLPLFQSPFKWSQSVSYTKSFGSSSTGTFLCRSQCSGTLAKLHQLGISFLWLQRSSSAQTPMLKESTFTFNYSVNTAFFDWKKRR